VLSIALTADGTSIGRLVLAGEALADHEREPFLAFANQTALALERARLREEALRAKLLEGVDRLAKTLVAAVSHDLRTPLASIKMSASTLCDPARGPQRRAQGRARPPDRQPSGPVGAPRRQPARHEPDPSRRARAANGSSSR
jgi:K+-sensing histidine kinase KdpD